MSSPSIRLIFHGHPVVGEWIRVHHREHQGRQPPYSFRRQRVTLQHERRVEVQGGVLQEKSIQSADSGLTRADLDLAFR